MLEFLMIQKLAVKLEVKADQKKDAHFPLHQLKNKLPVVIVKVRLGSSILQFLLLFVMPYFCFFPLLFYILGLLCKWFDFYHCLLAPGHIYGWTCNYCWRWRESWEAQCGCWRVCFLITYLTVCLRSIYNPQVTNQGEGE